jgi:hypothetical protein
MRSAKVAISGTSAGDKSQKRGDKSHQPLIYPVSYLVKRWLRIVTGP